MNGFNRNGDSRTPEQIREHYEVERELAAKLKNATRDERRLLYAQVYDERNKRVPHHPLMTRVNDLRAQMSAATPQVRLLRPFVRDDTVFMEVGAGDCAVALAMTGVVRKVYAVDVVNKLSPERRLPPNFEFRQFNGIDIPVAPESVDLVYSNDVIEHIHPDDALDQLRSVLSAIVPGGAYICVTPNRLSGPHDISRYFDKVATGFHMKEYSIHELEDTFHKAGFADVRAFVSYHGHIMSPLMPVAPYVAVEWFDARLPRPASRRLARTLAAVKVIGIKAKH
jgi:SAM-dependent methyltransferase